jgi:phosphoserine aminotransferase
MHKHYFTPGPSTLYHTVAEHLKKAMREQIPSISHRSASFQGIYQKATEGLRTLMDVPSDWHILFTASATEIWERLLQNTVMRQSYHAVNGEFSARFHQFAEVMGLDAEKQEWAPGKGVSLHEIGPKTAPELIALTHNETSTGAMMSDLNFHELRSRFPEALIAVDAVSSAPFPEWQYATIDCFYFSVQKGFGLPAGLGVWVLNDRVMAKAEEKRRLGHPIGTYRALPDMMAKAKLNQTVETPNVLGIYLLAQVCEDFNRIGIDQIRREIRYKSALLKNTINQHPSLSPFVEEKAHQSASVAVAEVAGGASNLRKYLEEKHMIVGSGYGPYKQAHIRIANFPAHSKEQMELLVDYLNQWV